MKKLFYLFLLLPLSLCVSCKDNDDISPVDMTLTLSGVTQVDDTFYAVAGEDITIDSLKVQSIDGKDSGVANVIYYLDGYPLIGDPMNPFLGTFSTANLAPGTHTIGVEGNLLQVDASIQVFAVTYNLNIIDNLDNLPAGAPDFGTYSQTLRLSN